MPQLEPRGILSRMRPTWWLARSWAVALAACVACSSTPPDERGGPAPQASATAAPVSSHVRTSDGPPPERWSTIHRDPATRAAFAQRPGANIKLAVSMESADGYEGELYLEEVEETEGGRLFGRWGTTAVQGKLAGRDIELDDVGTERVIFRGTLENDVVRGTLRAEGEDRAAWSQPPPARIDDASWGMHFAGGYVSILVEGGEPGRANMMLDHRPVPSEQVSVVRTAHGLALHEPRGRWELRLTAWGMLGRIGDDLIRIPGPRVYEPLKYESPVFTRDGVTFVGESSDLTDESCARSVQWVVVTGTPRDAELAFAMRHMTMDLATGAWPPFEARPSRPCSPRRPPGVWAPTDSAGLEVGLLGNGLFDLRMTGSRGQLRVKRCSLLDVRRGTLHDLLDELPSKVRGDLTKRAARYLARRIRSADLRSDEDYPHASLQGLAGTAMCVSPAGLRLAFDSVVSAQPDTNPWPLWVDVPRAVILPDLPEGHLLRRAWESKAP
jgi:hypothetical protein